MAKELIFGLNPIIATLESSPDRVIRIWLEDKRDDRRIQKLLDLAGRHGVSVERANRRALDRMSGEQRHQGAVAEYRMPPSGDEKDLQRLLEGLGRPPFLLVLDGVQDPHNLGACLRSADAAGIDAVIVPKDKAVGLTPTVCKVASGAADTTPLIRVTNLARSLKALQDAGVWLVGLAGEADEELYDIDLTGPLAVVMGNEGKGLRSLTRKHCDRLLRIPMVGQVESLNVSVATGVVLFEALRQRLG